MLEAFLDSHPNPDVANFDLLRRCLEELKKGEAAQTLVGEAYVVVGVLTEPFIDDPELSRAMTVLSDGEGSLLPFNPTLVMKSEWNDSVWLREFERLISPTDILPIREIGDMEDRKDSL